MPAPSIEERLTAIEKELEQIKQQLETNPSQTNAPWWEQIFGTFANSEAYDEAMRLGHEYRVSLRPKDDEDVS
ncbi:MAG TPA: hypothetical protein VFA07_09415 [Chthonomonadaceae bacterium]|nr:hypothetical protein [Chthonomonadaceae bacterium]